MGLSFPRKFTHLQKVGHADVRAELYLRPDGHFQYMVDINNTDPLKGNSIHVSFALFDEKDVLLGIYGMPSDQAWYVAPLGHLRAGLRYDELHGQQIPGDELKKTRTVALLFRQQGLEMNTTSLQGLAAVGSELGCRPIPA